MAERNINLQEDKDKKKKKKELVKDVMADQRYV